eukprot:363899-Chlamydomonas_euryale.AAC.4
MLNVCRLQCSAARSRSATHAHQIACHTCRKKLLNNVCAIAPDRAWVRSIVLAALVVNLAEESLDTASLQPTAGKHMQGQHGARKPSNLLCLTLQGTILPNRRSLSSDLI